MDQPRLILHNLISLILARLEQFWQREPLSRHLVPIIGVHELIVIHAVRRVTTHALHGGLAAVEGDDVVDERLARGGELEGFGGVGGVVFRGVGLAGLEVLARGGGGDGGVFDVAVGGRHGSGCGDSAELVDWFWTEKVRD